MAEVSYVGNYGYDIEISRNLNALPNSYLNTDNSRTALMVTCDANLRATVANPFLGSTDFAGTTFANSTIARSQLLLPFPNFGAVTTTNNDGKSWYNSAQVNFKNGFRRGSRLEWRIHGQNGYSRPNI